MGHIALGHTDAIAVEQLCGAVFVDAEVALLLLEGGLSDRRLRNGLAGATLAVSG